VTNDRVVRVRPGTRVAGGEAPDSWYLHLNIYKLISSLFVMRVYNKNNVNISFVKKGF
jgi:hypothetical protein